MILEKDRSYNGFYLYSATWSASINGVSVVSTSGSVPHTAWTGWNSNTIASGTTTVTHNPDGTLTGMPVTATYAGANSGWAIGTVTTVPPLTMDLPAIPRATIATVTPSPAATASTVTINLPRTNSAFTHDISYVAGTLSGSVGTGFGTSTTWVVPDVSTGFLTGSPWPIVLTVTTKNGTTVIGTSQVTLFAKTPPPAPTLSPASPAKRFDIRARNVVYDGTGWFARSKVPASTIQMVDPSSATATATISLSKLNATSFNDYSIVDVDVFDGTNWLFTNHRFVLSRSTADDVDPTQTVSYSGTEYVDYLLGFAYLQKSYYWDGSTNNPNPTSPGNMIANMIVDAQTRGWGPRVGISFNGSVDSNGVPWANTAVSRTYDAGTPISQVLAGLVTDGLVEYRVHYTNEIVNGTPGKAWLDVYNAGTGLDYSSTGASPVVNLSLAKLTRAPRKSTMEKQITAVTVAGDKQQITRTAAPFDANVFGRLEGWVSATGVILEDNLGAIGDSTLASSISASDELTFEYTAQDAAPQFYPYFVFRTGDWVLRPSGSNTIRDRIGQITIDKSVDDTVKLTVLTGTLIISGTATLAKRMSAQTGGSIAGGTLASPAPLDTRIPSGPIISSVTSAGYWTTDGTPKSAVTVNWATDATSLSGSPIVVSLYEVWWRPSGIGAQWTFRGATDQDTITLNNWDVQEVVDIRVRAQSSAGVYGEFSIDQTAFTTAAPTVSLPTGPDLANLYTDGVGSLYAVWGGTLGGVAPPAYLAYVSAEISSNGGTTYAQAGTPITAAGTIVINPNAYGTFEVRLRGYDRLGNAGAVSTPQTISTIDPHVNPPNPVAPSGLTATPGAAWNATGFLPTAWFDLAWTAPTLDTNGAAIIIAGYDIYGFKTGETVERLLTSTATASARISVGNGETWTFRVRASSNFGGVSSESAAVIATANAAIAAAAAPAAPSLSQYAGILQIQWSGTGIVPQIAYAYATISTSPTGTFTRAGMPLTGAGEIDVPGLATGVTYYAKIVMVDTLGSLSTSVASAGLLLNPITGVTFQTSALANTGIKITNAGMTAYNASGAPTFTLNAGTGEVWIAPYAAVFTLGAAGTVATTGAATTGIEISDQSSSFNTFIHPSGVQIRSNATPLSWWEADATDSSLVNFFSPRAVIGQRLLVGDFEMLKEAKSTGTRLVIRYKGA